MATAAAGLGRPILVIVDADPGAREETVSALVRRFAPPSVTGPITWGPPTAMIHGPHELPLRLAPRSPITAAEAPVGLGA